MSPLTKLFVVLLVILSMLMTAATVVYVNKEDEMKASLETTRNELSAQRAKTERDAGSLEPRPPREGPPHILNSQNY